MLERHVLYAWGLSCFPSESLAVNPTKLLFLIADDFPTHRPDVTVLFGKELPRHGVICDLVAQCAAEHESTDTPWPAGRACLCPRTGNRTRDQLTAFMHDVRTLAKAKATDYDAIQVRDKVFAGLFGLARARRLGLPFFFWMSYPMSEGFIDLSRREGLSLGVMRWAFVTSKGYLGRTLLYRFLLPRCSHVFVQSEHMADMLVRKGIDRSRLTAVPMGVDLEQLSNCTHAPTEITDRLAGKRVIAYQGSLDRVRRIDRLLESLTLVRRTIPQACLLLIGDTSIGSDRQWLESRARELDVADAVVWTGWVPTATVWALLRHAEVGVSLIPRGELYDYSSPTKVVEYLALGLPVVANDLPDQQTLLAGSGAGLCVTSDISDFAGAIVRILTDPNLAARMRARGPPYIRDHRSYDSLGRLISEVYASCLLKRNSHVERTTDCPGLF